MLTTSSVSASWHFSSQLISQTQPLSSPCFTILSTLPDSGLKLSSQVTTFLEIIYYMFNNSSSHLQPVPTVHILHVHFCCYEINFSRHISRSASLSQRRFNSAITSSKQHQVATNGGVPLQLSQQASPPKQQGLTHSKCSTKAFKWDFDFFKIV